jgi:hypothetical protein
MPSRRWSRLALALLLLWQLNAAVAVAVPHAKAALAATAQPAAPCARHTHSGPDPAGQPDHSPAPRAPDCCRDLSAGCHCAQLPALSMGTLDLAEAPAPGLPPAGLATPHIDARGADFFRPPI